MRGWVSGRAGPAAGEPANGREHLSEFRSGAENTAAENALIDYVVQNILIGTFPNNPNCYYILAGVPTVINLPASIAGLVSAVTANVTSNAQVDLKSYFGTTDIYGIAYHNTTADPLATHGRSKYRARSPRIPPAALRRSAPL
jgi:hypothetical protein